MGKWFVLFNTYRLKKRRRWENEIGLFGYEERKTVSKFATIQLEQDRGIKRESSTI